MMFEMIKPSGEYQPLKELRPTEVSFVVRGICSISIFKPLVRWIRAAQRFRVLRRILPNLMAQARNWSSREQLEQVLGKPRFVLEGKGCILGSRDGGLVEPDLMEVYETKGCMIEIFFKDGQAISLGGSEKMTHWDTLAGVPWKIRARKRQRKHRKKLRSLAPSEEEKLLSRPFNLETFKLFLQTYFWQAPEEGAFQSLVTKSYDYLKATGKFSILADLKEILVKTQKIRDTYEKDRMPLSGVSEFVLLYALVHPEAENALVKLLLLPPNYVATYRKYEYTAEEGTSD